MLNICPTFRFLFNWFAGLYNFVLTPFLSFLFAVYFPVVYRDVDCDFRKGVLDEFDEGEL